MARKTLPYRLAAIYNPIGTAPSFVFPAFIYGGANTAYIQNVDVEGIIDGFEALEVAQADLVSITDSAPIVAIGDPAIWAFQLSDGEVILGTQMELARQLEPLLRRDEFVSFPLIHLEVAEFCRSNDLIAPALQRCFRHMARISDKAATYWRDVVVLTAFYRVVLRQASERKGLRINPGLWREVQFVAEGLSRPQLWVPHEIFRRIEGDVPLLDEVRSSAAEYMGAFDFDPDSLEFAAPASASPQRVPPRVGYVLGVGERGEKLVEALRDAARALGYEVAASAGECDGAPIYAFADDRDLIDGYYSGLPQGGNLLMSCHPGVSSDWAVDLLGEGLNAIVLVPRQRVATPDGATPMPVIRQFSRLIEHLSLSSDGHRSPLRDGMAVFSAATASGGSARAPLGFSRAVIYGAMSDYPLGDADTVDVTVFSIKEPVEFRQLWDMSISSFFHGDARWRWARRRYLPGARQRAAVSFLAHFHRPRHSRSRPELSASLLGWGTLHHLDEIERVHLGKETARLSVATTLSDIEQAYEGDVIVSLLDEYPADIAGNLLSDGVYLIDRQHLILLEGARSRWAAEFAVLSGLSAGAIRHYARSVVEQEVHKAIMENSLNFELGQDLMLLSANTEFDYVAVDDFIVKKGRRFDEITFHGEGEVSVRLNYGKGDGGVDFPDRYSFTFSAVATVDGFEITSMKADVSSFYT